MSDPRWAALCAATETNRPHEQVAVLWVLRNRVETGGWFGSTYEEVILKPYQFSAFNRYTTGPDRWEPAEVFAAVAGRVRLTASLVALAEQVIGAPRSPFDRRVKHFWSPQSMVPKGSVPGWAKDMECFTLEGIPAERFVWALETSGPGNGADFDFRHLYQEGETA